MRLNWANLRHRVAAAAVLVAAAFCGTGCSPGAFAGLALIAPLKNDQLVQHDRTTASAAADKADTFPCDAAAPYRAAARAASDQATQTANQSAAIASQSQAALDQHAQALSFLSQARERVDQVREAQRAAGERFARSLQGDGVPRDDAVLGNVIRAAGEYSDATLAVARAMAGIADDFQIMVTTGSGVLPQFIPEGVDAGQLAATFKAAAENQLTQAIEVANTAYTVPADMDVLVGSFHTEFDPIYGRQNTDPYNSFAGAMVRLHTFGGQVESGQDLHGAGEGWEAAQSMLSGVARNAESFLSNAGRQTSDLSRQSASQAAEAVRNGWLAQQACGEPIPPGVLDDLTNPFTDYNNPYPDWNSTFWDFSSP